MYFVFQVKYRIWIIFNTLFWFDMGHSVLPQNNMVDILSNKFCKTQEQLHVTLYSQSSQVNRWNWRNLSEQNAVSVCECPKRSTHLIHSIKGYMSVYQLGCAGLRYSIDKTKLLIINLSFAIKWLWTWTWLSHWIQL